MGVEAVTSATTTSISGSTADNAAASASLDYDSFLTLLIAQMQNQDPTEPMDSTEQIAQLATFSQVEQTIQTNKNLETLIQSSVLTQAGTVIGKTVSSTDGSISGIVEQVKIYTDGAVAVLENGTEVVIGPGMVIEN